MPSNAHQIWLTERNQLLDEIESAHRSVRRTGVGAKLARSQITQAYTVMLSGQFQAFCRDLHAECIVCLLDGIPLGPRRIAIRTSLELGRKLDSGNPNPGNLGSDFGRFAFKFWDLVDAHRTGNDLRKKQLDDLNVWRNSVAHQHFPASMLRGSQPRLTLRQVQEWRNACNELAESFDEVMKSQLQYLTGSFPW